MQVKLENLEGLERKLSFALAWADVNAEVSVRLKKAQRKAKVHGFRPGKAPMKMVESMYGAEIQEDVLNEFARKAFYTAADEQDIRIAGYPRFEPEKEQADKAIFQLNAIFEVFPEVTVGELSGKEVEKIFVDVTEAEVDKTIDILRKQRTSFHHVAREAQNGDRVMIDFKGCVDGVPFEGGSAENFPLVLGEGRMLPEFEAGVLGMKEGEVKDVTVQFPEDYHGKDVAGKAAVFTMSMKNVSEPKFPEMNADFARSLGIEDGDVEKMRAEVKKNIEREVKRRVNDKNKEKAFQAVLDVTKILVPKSLVQEESGRMMQEMQQNFVSQGLDPKQLPQLPAEMFQKQAERRVALGLILAKLVEDNQLQAKDEQVKEVIAEFADSYEDPSEVIEWYFADKQRMQGPMALAVEANAVDFILGQVKVTEKEESFDEIMGAQAGQN